MPVSPLPLILPTLLVGVPLFFLTRGRKPFLRAAATSAALVAMLFLWVYVPGGILRVRAGCGDPEAVYEFARWTENHNEQIGRFVPWPVSPDVFGGYVWLERAAALDYPPAVYAVGVRLKHDWFVPHQNEPAEPRSSQTERGQQLIDKALRLGYQPVGKEEDFYWQQYRK